MCSGSSRAPAPSRAVVAGALALALAGCDRTPAVHALVPDSLLAGVDDPVAAFNVETHGARTRPVLRACADPNNMPFTNARLEGFENELVALIARELGRDTAWTWFPQRRGFARMTLGAGRCDVIAGVPSSYERALTTVPYYRSTYVFVTRADRALDITSLDDARLRALRIGIHTVGDDYANTPAAHALVRRGLVDNVVGYSIYGDYAEDSPPARLIEAVANGDVDVAVVWGPIAGWFARAVDTELRLVPVTPQIDPPFTLFVFDVSMAVRRGDDPLKAELERALARKAPEISALLERYGVPLVRGARAR